MRILAIPFLIEASKRNQVASVQQGLFHFLFICEELKNVLVDIVVVVVNVTDVVIIVVDVDVAAVAVAVVNAVGRSRQFWTLFMVTLHLLNLLDKSSRDGR